MKRLSAILLAATSGLLMICALRAKEASQTHVDPNGVVRVPELAVPLSSYMSEQAKQALIAYTRKPMNPLWSDLNAPIEKLRELDEAELRPSVERVKARYAVEIVERNIGGVRTRVVTPKAGVAPRNAQKVLIELHGGGFFTGAGGQALLESIPVAALGGYKVIAVDYRQGPEHKFPAATEDVAHVYRELLKEHSASDVGLFGCSAGGSLAAMAVAWIQKEKLPKPGAIGIFSAGAFAGFTAPPSSPGAWGGDSRYVAPVLNGEPSMPIDAKDIPLPAVTTAYLDGADLQDPLASPALHPDVLAKFPPTLVLTGTRGFDMSAAVQTHRALVKAGVDADLRLWDGVGHCFFADADLPESQEAFHEMTKFFDRHLGEG
jgi:epsilon-lactone hydrolase